MEENWAKKISETDSKFTYLRALSSPESPTYISVPVVHYSWTPICICGKNDEHQGIKVVKTTSINYKCTSNLQLKKLVWSVFFVNLPTCIFF